MHALGIRRAREHGCTMPDAEIQDLLGTDAELNAQGLVVWLERQRRAS
jgi:hypothetical protein